MTHASCTHKKTNEKERKAKIQFDVFEDIIKQNQKDYGFIRGSPLVKVKLTQSSCNAR